MGNYKPRLCALIAALCLLVALPLRALPEDALFTLSAAPSIAFADATAPPADSTAQPEASPSPNASGFTLEIIRAGERENSDGAISVLIYHTHTYEAYTATQAHPYTPTEKWRTANADCNVTAVGAYLAKLLQDAGLRVTHDTTAFEPPSLSSAYERSLQMLTSRHDAGERYDLYIDLHRDAYSQNNGSNTVSLGDVDAARLMFLIGKGTGQTAAGYDPKPDWESNLALAQRMTDEMNIALPGLCRNVSVKNGRYNQHIADKCVLIEVGNNRNTLEEALAAMPPLANAICAALE